MFLVERYLRRHAFATTDRLRVMSATPQSPEESEDEPSVRDADGEGNLIALFVLDDIPVEVRLTGSLLLQIIDCCKNQTINMVLAWNYEQSDSKIWPADTYDTIPDYDGTGPMPQI